MLWCRCVKPIVVATFCATLLLVARPASPMPPEPIIPTFYAVRIDGATIGAVTEAARAEVESVLEELVLSQVERAGVGAELVQRVTIEPVSLDDAKVVPVGVVIDHLAKNLEVMVRGAVLLVEGEPLAVFCGASDAKEVLAEMIADHELVLFDIIRRERGKVQELVILDIAIEQDVCIREGLFDPAAISPRTEAIALLRKGTLEERTHTVASGETLWGIANRNNMSVEDLASANPQVSDPGRLRPGDELSLVVAKPYISIISSERITYSQPISFHTQIVHDNAMWPWERQVRQTGINGEKLVTIQTQRRDGALISTGNREETILSQPRTQIIAQGSKPVPALGTGKLLWPLDGKVTSLFGWRSYRFHAGVDIAAPVGTPIRAADSGVVVASSWVGHYGNLIAIDHGGKTIQTYYGHLSSRHVNVGTRVDKGQVIGLVGNTGRSTGPHLHFEVRVNGTPVDPMQYFRDN